MHKNTKGAEPINLSKAHSGHIAAVRKPGLRFDFLNAAQLQRQFLHSSHQNNSAVRSRLFLLKLFTIFSTPSCYRNWEVLLSSENIFLPVHLSCVLFSHKAYLNLAPRTERTILMIFCQRWPKLSPFIKENKIPPPPSPPLTQRKPHCNYYHSLPTNHTGL